MSLQQRAELDAQIRSMPYDPNATIEQRRAGFAKNFSTPVPDDVTARDTTVGGVPALELTIPDAGPGVLLYLHGGGYVIGSPTTHTGLAIELGRRIGMSALSLNYRLAPEHPFPAAPEDSIAAYRALLDGGVAPGDIVIAGDSAGGGLTIATLLSARDAGLPMPAAVAVFSPWADLTLSGASIESKKDADPLFTLERIGWFAGHYLGDQDAATPLASPVFADLTGLPPLLIQVGSHEILLDDATRLATNAGAVDVDVTLQIWADLPHVFQSRTATLDEANQALDAAGQFLTRHLHPTTR